MNILLSGIVGSTAYGLAGPDSDVDRLGVYADETIGLVGLHPIVETQTRTKPDVTRHEAAKFCRLALACNPTVSDLLWLPDALYEVRTPLGDELIGIRSAFLSRDRVRDAYLGYASQQCRKLIGRSPEADDGAAADPARKRIAKHARHLMRLSEQGLELYATGALTVRLADPERVIDFGARVASGDLDAARDLVARVEAEFAAATPVLPERPDEPAAAAWLRRVRLAFWRPEPEESS
ncbi:MAG TPA: nucleotidyltransferase domain-containing protein [Micromonosporaceae bacterium]